ncbi:hypothetical protein JNB91_15940 [Rhizobium wenxiniae]|uniref:DUF6716 putative glycosyltransferase n=1 Tax=Rhizobium wenxiniae TaxID=1737357 RepID=UPI001C6ECD58|nr:DUF6716 putative glycosyltransferase [Rhizobium wenxiniae]MBW9089327.1 hypothetical protein [Rhizobium wenxiniae]
MQNAHHRSKTSDEEVKIGPTKAVLVYAADSYVGFCQILYEYLTLKGVAVSVLEVSDVQESTGLTERQREKWGITIPPGVITRLRSDKLLDYISASSADYLFLGLTGRAVFRICKALHHQKKNSQTPIIATGFPGLQFRLMMEGVILRCFVDRLLFTDPTLMKKSRAFLSLLPFRTAQCILFGSPRLRAAPVYKRARDRPYVVFFDQNVVPQEYEARVRLADSILTLAAEFPEKIFLVVGRANSGEMSYHSLAGDVSIEALIAGRTPQNVASFSGNWTDIQADIHLSFSVSSTAILEAAALGIPSYSIVVEGDVNTRFSAQAFYRSLGLQRTQAELAQEIREPCSDMSTSAARKHMAPFNKSSLPLLFSPAETASRPEAPIFVQNYLFRLSKIGDWILSKLR